MEMMDSIQILKERYLKNIKENPTVYIGIELEFPIVNSQGGATDTNVAKNLLKHLLEEYDFESERFDRDGNPIQLKSTKNEDRILLRSLTILWNLLLPRLVEFKKLKSVLRTI